MNINKEKTIIQVRKRKVKTTLKIKIEIQIDKNNLGNKFLMIMIIMIICQQKIAKMVVSCGPNGYFE